MPLHLLYFVLAGFIVAPSIFIERNAEICDGVRTSLNDEEDVPVDGDVVELSILKLKNARYRQGRPLPQWVADLDGKRVRIWGYMAIGTLEGLSQFELVPESCECGRSKVNHFVEVTLTEGQTRFIPGRITLEGTFYASEIEEDGFITSLYRLKTDVLPR